MKIDEKIRARIVELVTRGEALARARPQWGNAGGEALLHEKDGWLASAMNVLELVFPNPLSAHRSQAMTVLRSHHSVGSLTEILKAALVDVDAGVVAGLADAARAEVFDDFLDQAQYYLDGRKIPQAGVIAGVVFEDTVRKVCDKLKILGKGEKLDLLISAMEQRQVLTPIKAKRARAAADLRTRASHADWDKFGASDVDATIRFTRELIDSMLA